MRSTKTTTALAAVVLGLLFCGAVAQTPAAPKFHQWALLTNDEVIAVHQRSTNNRQLFASSNNTHFAWVADVPGSKDKYVAIFNASPAPVGGQGRGRGGPGVALVAQPAPAPVDSAATQLATISLSLADIGLTGPCKVRDLCGHKDLGTIEAMVSATMNSHGAVLYMGSPV
jgi:alpha-galactosidase